MLDEKLLEVMGDDVTQEQAFAHANDVLKNAVSGISDISDIIHVPGLVNVDFENVKTVMSEPGTAMMGTATASGPDRAKKAADAACPLLEDIDLGGARRPAIASRSGPRAGADRGEQGHLRAGREPQRDEHGLSRTGQPPSNRRGPEGRAMRRPVVAIQRPGQDGDLVPRGSALAPPAAV